MEAAYKLLADFSEGGVGGRLAVGEMLEEAALLREHQDLFEIHVCEYLPLTRCKVRRIYAFTVVCCQIWNNKVSQALK